MLILISVTSRLYRELSSFVPSNTMPLSNVHINKWLVSPDAIYTSRKQKSTTLQSRRINTALQNTYRKKEKKARVHCGIDFQRDSMLAVVKSTGQSFNRHHFHPQLGHNLRLQEKSRPHEEKERVSHRCRHFPSGSRGLYSACAWSD